MDEKKTMDEAVETKTGTGNTPGYELGRPDITDSASAENFYRQSLLNKREIAALLDDWIERIDRNDMEIELAPAAAAALRKAVARMREKTVESDLPAIRKKNARYELNLFHDVLQLGIVEFPADERFDEQGRPIPVPVPAEDETDGSGEPDGEAQDGNDPAEPYTLLMRVPIPWWPIDKWAEANNVKPGTARQWAHRGRIKSEKAEGMLRVPAIQYTPDAFARARTTTYRFHMIGTLPEELVAKYPDLDGEIFDLLVMQAARTADGAAPGKPFAAFAIKRMDGAPALSSAHWEMDAAERDRLVEDLYSVDGVGSQSDKYYRNPIGPELAVPGSKHPDLAPVDEAGKKILDGIMIDCTVKSHGSAGNYDGHSDKTYEAAPRFEIEAAMSKDAVRIGGHLAVLAQDERVDLLRAIFGQEGPVQTIREIFREAGIPRTKQYPWDRKVALVTDLSTGKSSPEETAVLLRALPYVLRNHASFETDLVMLALPDARTARVLEQAGYACCRKKAPRKRALYYAYTPVRRKARFALRPKQAAQAAPAGRNQEKT